MGARSALGEVTERYQRRGRWLRRIGSTLAVVAIVPSVIVLWVDGHMPALTPKTSESFSTQPLREAYSHVDVHSGLIDMSMLVDSRAPLDRYLDQLAASSPENQPWAFPRPADKLAFWLNAYNAIVVQQMIDTWPNARTAGDLSHYRRTWPVGGSRLTLFSIERRYLREAGDARIWLALFTGARGGGLLDGSPFDPATIEGQLNDAAKRFMRRKENVSISGTTVSVSALLQQHEEEFLAALTPERRNILQIVWAYLPDNCEGERPGCDTRGDLDRACGPEFDRCQVRFTPVDTALAVRKPN